MIEFGIAGKPSVSKNLQQGMAYLNKIGLEALELQFGRGMRIGEDALKKITIAAHDNGIKLSAHAPYYINLNSKNPETVVKSRKWILDTVAIAQKTDSYLVVIHAGVLNDEYPDATTRITQELRPVIEELEDAGSNILLGLETMGRDRSWGLLDEIKELCKMSKLIVPVIDFAHIHARFNGMFKTQQDYEKVLSDYDELGLGSLHAHFTSIEYGPKGEKKHLPVSNQDPPFLPLAKALKKREYPIRLICESPLLEMDALQLKEWYYSV
jgi:deoxyribonuclease-4